MDWSLFGMDRQPFRPAVDPDSYFPAVSHEEALAAVAAAFARRDPIVLIDGPAGVGKTLVARKWLEHLLPDVTRVVIPNGRAKLPAELLQAILFDMVKPYQGFTEQELRLAVTGHLLDTATEGTFPTVLVIDEAQHLSDTVFEELRLLGNLETRRGTALFVLLVAAPALRETLRLPAYESFAQRMPVRAAIASFTPAESADYIRHQIRAAGGDETKVIAVDAIAMLAGASRGVPRLLNRVAAMAFELAAGGETEQVDVEAALEAIDRLGLTIAEESETTEPVLLPHPARTAEPTQSRRAKSVVANPTDEAETNRKSKTRAPRKRSA